MKQIESILTLVRSTLDILEMETYKVYDKFTDITKHIFDDNYYQRKVIANETK